MIRYDTYHDPSFAYCNPWELIQKIGHTGLVVLFSRQRFDPAAGQTLVVGTAQEVIVTDDDARLSLADAFIQLPTGVAIAPEHEVVSIPIPKKVYESKQPKNGYNVLSWSERDPSGAILATNRLEIIVEIPDPNIK